MRVTVFEKYPEAGGLVGVVEVGGTPLERFYHHLFTSDVDYVSFAEEFGLGGDIQWLKSRMGFFSNGRLFDFGTPASPLLLAARRRGTPAVRPVDAEAQAERGLEESRGRDRDGLDAPKGFFPRSGRRVGPPPRPEVRAPRRGRRPRLALGKDRAAHAFARQDRPRREARVPEGLVRARRRGGSRAREGARRRPPDVPPREDREEVRRRIRRGVRGRDGDVRPRPLDGRDPRAPEARAGPSRRRAQGMGAIAYCHALCRSSSSTARSRRTTG